MAEKHEAGPKGFIPEGRRTRWTRPLRLFQVSRLNCCFCPQTEQCYAGLNGAWPDDVKAIYWSDGELIWLQVISFSNQLQAGSETLKLLHPTTSWETEEEEGVLPDLNDSDHQPAAHFPPQLTGPHLQENLHVLQNRQPSQDPLLGHGLQEDGRVMRGKQQKVHVHMHVAAAHGSESWRHAVSSQEG